MKKLVLVFLAFAMAVSFAGCGKSAAAKQVDAMIEAIGDATLENEEMILAAERAYEALSDAEKAEVEYADFLPIYRNNLEVLKQEAAYESLRSRLEDEWVDLYEPENHRVLIRADGTAEIDGHGYDWTLNRNLQTIRFEGDSLIVMAVEKHDALLVLHNPDLMTCMKREDYEDFAEKALVTVLPDQNEISEYFGPAIDLGVLLDADGKDTGAHRFAFHSNAYYRGLVYFRVAEDFALNYNAGKKLHGVLYEPYGASYITDPRLIPSLQITGISAPIRYIRAEFVSALRYDSETKERVITLSNGIELKCASTMNPSYKTAVFNVYDYLSDPGNVF